MIKTHWVRNAAVLGTVVTLSLVCSGSVHTDAVTATGFSQEKQMAGISLSFDKYYDEKTADTQNDSAKEEKNEKADSDKTDTKKSNSSDNSEQKRKEDLVSKQFVNLGIATSSDYVNIRKKPTTESKILGKLYKGSSAKILGEKNGWAKIESGSVTGYIRKDLLAIGAKAQKLAGKYGTAYASLKKGTITLNVRAKKSTKAKILTQIPEDEKYEILGESDNWYKISLDDCNGYIAKEFVNTKVKFKKAVSIAEEKAEERRKKAAEKAAAEAEAARERAAEAARQASSSSSSRRSSSSSSSRKSSSSRSSRRSSSSSSSRRTTRRTTRKVTRRIVRKRTSSQSSASTSTSGSGSSVASYAQKFVGNPYVWGGSSLTHGTDCSGFTMSVYARFGRSLPHSAAAQSGCGSSVSLSNLQPGDLLFYGSGRISHVAMYIGGGQVVHASNRKDGIKISYYKYRTPVCARRIL